MAVRKRQIVPRPFFLNETHELSPLEKAGGGRVVQYSGISWAARAKQISDSLDKVRDQIVFSDDPLKNDRYFVLAQPVPEIQKVSSNKRKAPTGIIREKPSYGGVHGKVFDRLGLDLLQVTDDGSAIVHAAPATFDRLAKRSEELDSLGSREQSRWVTISSFSTVPLQVRVDAEWLESFKRDEIADFVVELQPVLTRIDADTVLRAIAELLTKAGPGQRLMGMGVDFSGRHWFRGRATQRSVRTIAKNYYSVQSIHSPLYSFAAGKSKAQSGPVPKHLPSAAAPNIDDLPCVAVVDLGVATDHSRLRHYRRGQFVPLEAPRSPVGDHGAFVASRVVFGDLDGPDALATASGQCTFYDAMVGESPFVSGGYDRINDKIVMEAIRGVRGAADDVRVFNLSIGDTRPLGDFPPVERREKRLLMQDLDNFVFATDSLVVVAAGNSGAGVTPSPAYPGHYDDPRWALGPWACGFNTLICGSYVSELSTAGLVKNIGWPSPFTRVGPGLCASPVPSFSAPGGNTDDSHACVHGLGVWGFSGSGLPEDRNGTSFAAPILAREAAIVTRSLQRFCEHGSHPFAVTARSLLTLTADPPVEDAHVQPLVERTLGHGRANSRRFIEPAAGSAIILWQGYIESPADKLRVQLPIPREWLLEAGRPTLRIIFCHDPPVNEAALQTWACRKLRPVLHPGPDVRFVRPSGSGGHRSYSVVDRHYDLAPYKPGEATGVEGDVWLIELSYEEIAPYPPAMDFDPRQRVAFAAELVDRAENAVDPQPAMQSLPIAPSMNRLSTQPLPIRSPIILRTRLS
jgi:hypothetical protein